MIRRGEGRRWRRPRGLGSSASIFTSLGRPQPAAGGGEGRWRRRAGRI